MYLLIVVVVLLGAYWFFAIRPQQRRAAEQRAKLGDAPEGTRVMLTSGVFGTIAGRTDDHVLVTIAEGVTIEVVAAAIGHILPKEEPAVEAGVAVDADLATAEEN